MIQSHRLVASVTLLMVVIAHPVHAGLYRWVDDNGKVHYSDSMPPEVAHRNSDLLNKQGILIKKIVPPSSMGTAKDTSVEIRENQRQLAADRSLLAAYRHEQDIVDARDENIAIISAAQLVINGNIHRTRLHLLHMLTLTDKQVSDLKKLLQRNYDSLFRYDSEREYLENKYHALLLRYRHIKQHGAGTDLAMDTTTKTQKMQLSCHDSHLKCTDTKTCQRWWKRTKQFINDNSDMPTLIESDSLLSTKMPINRNEISLSAALKLNDSEGLGEILLDLDCGDINSFHVNATSDNSETSTFKGECISQRSKLIRQRFRPYVTGAD